MAGGAGGESFISGADYAVVFIDEIDKPAHRQARFTVAYWAGRGPRLSAPRETHGGAEGVASVEKCFRPW